jgi:hypothetical protein
MQAIRAGKGWKMRSRLQCTAALLTLILVGGCQSELQQDEELDPVTLSVIRKIKEEAADHREWSPQPLTSNRLAGAFVPRGEDHGEGHGEGDTGHSASESSP